MNNAQNRAFHVTHGSQLDTNNTLNLSKQHGFERVSLNLDPWWNFDGLIVPAADPDYNFVVVVTYIKGENDKATMMMMLMIE